METVKFHSKKNATWTNAAGESVPFKFVPGVDKAKEQYAQKIYADALKAENALQELYIMMNSAFTAIEAELKKEYEIKNGKKPKAGKGGMTWYNFDKSLKIEADTNDILKWDSAMMAEALVLFNKFLDSNLTATHELIKELVTGGFANSKQQIDSRKIFQLLKHESNIKNVNYRQACEIVRNAQTIDRTKLYMRVWARQGDGSYRNINLNFSNL